MADVLVQMVSSEPTLIRSVAEVAHSIGGLQLRTVSTYADARLALRGCGPAVMILHLVNQADAERIVGLTQEMVALRKSIATVVIAEGHQPEQTLTILRQAVADCLERPLNLRRLTYLLDVLTLRLRYRSGPAQLDSSSVVLEEDSLDHSSVPRAFLLKQVRKLAPLDINVLLQGETGTGKTQLARVIHHLSARRDQKFLVINCGSLSSQLIESEMFGHIRGAFTSADRDHKGKFAEVGRGTIFLDEIDSLPIEVQAKLLRVVDERVFEPVGSNQTVPMQARLIAASNRPLDQEVAAGRFRSDLFYRLNGTTFSLPTLRTESEIIPSLVSRFIVECCQRLEYPVYGISSDALRALKQYTWPGNIRELRHVIERAVMLCAGERIELTDLPESIRHRVADSISRDNPSVQDGGASVVANSPTVSDRRVNRVGRRATDLEIITADCSTLTAARERAEAAFIAQVLRRNNNNRQKTAAELGISRMTLYKKLYRYGLDTPGSESTWPSAEEPTTDRRLARRHSDLSCPSGPGWHGSTIHRSL